MNNIFKFATKELSQDAFLCWSINWITEGEGHPMYQYGKTMLDLFLADKKLKQYVDVEVRTQYDKIDILVMFKDGVGNSHALIIEDKTNTSEHGNQLLRYKENLIRKITKDAQLSKYETPEVHLAYIKTGIMYDEDMRIAGKGATVVDLDKLLAVVSHFAKQNRSEILSDFNEHIQEIKKRRLAIDNLIENCQYEEAFKDSYGQFCFMDKIFSDRENAKEIGKHYVEHEKNYPVFIDNIYAGTNNGGIPWIQYCFWGSKYPRNYYNESNINEYHYLFWRLDYNWKRDEYDKWIPDYYISLRHYDERAHSKVNYLNERKKFVYSKFRSIADAEYEKNKKLYKKIGKRENYKESDLLFIPIKNIKSMTIEEIKDLLTKITNIFKVQDESIYDEMEDALAKYDIN